MKKNITKALCFLVLLTIIIWRVNGILAFKHADGIVQMEQFYQLDEDTVDVLCMGSSHTYVNVNPAWLYQDYGIASYNLCASVQPMWNTYYYLKEALEYQTPDLIVLDVYRLVEEFDFSKESKLVKSTYGMRLSKNKIDAIKVSQEKEDFRELLMHLMEFPSYHSRYEELQAVDFVSELSGGENYKGSTSSVEVKKLKKPKLKNVTERAEIRPKTMEYFEKILLLAKEHDIPVLLINAPYQMTKEDKMIFNTLEDYLAQQTLYADVKYVDFNTMYKEMGLKFKRDFADENHLNITGQPKFNKALGEIIVDNYDIPDRRGDKRFESYEKNLEEFKKEFCLE